MSGHADRMLPMPPCPELIAHLQQHRREMLAALRACSWCDADYWRWQGHAELSRQLLERMGAEVPR